MREYGDYSEQEIESRVRSLFKKSGHRGDNLSDADQLSGGMQRRVAIARSLAACTPHMMLYDEPTTGLDPITADHICGLINELSAGPPSSRWGLAFVTHRVRDAAIVAERFMYLRDRISFDGNLEELKADQGPELKQFISELVCV